MVAATGLTRRGLLMRGGVLGLSAFTPSVIMAAGDPPAMTFLDPELQAAGRRLLADSKARPPLNASTLQAWRRQGAALFAAPLPGIPVENRKVPGPPGAPPVELFVINATGTGTRPCIVHTHGGGHVLGNARFELPYLQQFARDLDCVIISSNYRLAPEATYAQSVEDNYSVLRWVASSARTLGIDRERIALLGESAGGTHALLLAVAARDRGEIPLRFQSLIYPMLDDRTGSTERVPAPIGEVLWTAEQNAFGWRSFLGVQPGSTAVPQAGVPARLSKLSGLPPTYVAVGGADLFVGEDIAFAQRLTLAGVPTELNLVPRAFHAFDRVAPETAIAKRFHQAELDAFRRAFA